MNFLVILLIYILIKTKHFFSRKVYDFITFYREILKQTQRLENPVWYRLSRQSLLRLRQRYPEKFQVCFTLQRLDMRG